MSTPRTPYADACRQWWTRTGRLDVLHNNAGFGLVGMVEETSIEQARAVFETNYFGTVRVIRAALPIMRGQGRGLIVNTTSTAAYVGVPFEAHYCASKAAVAGLTRALRYELAAFGIEVVLISPGYVRTPFYDVMRRATGLSEYDGVRQRAVAAFEQSARFGSDATQVAREIARAILGRPTVPCTGSAWMPGSTAPCIALSLTSSPTG